MTLHVSKRDFRIFRSEELLDIPPASFLVEDVLEQNSLSVLVGPPGEGKTFVAFDMAAHIAMGRPWYDRSVRHGHVIYVAAEGHRVLAQRLRAWCKFYQCKPPRELYIAIEPVDLNGGMKSLEDFLLNAVGSLDMVQVDRDDEGEIIGEHEIPLQLIVFDTLARCIEGVDENSAQEMGKVVRWLDLLRDKEVTGLETSVMVVHHSGKNSLLERGSTALRGAADTMMLVSKDKHGPVLRCTKQKGGEPFEPMDFALVQLSKAEPILIPRERIGELIPDAESKGYELPKPKNGRLGPTQKKFLIVLADQAGPEGLTVSEIARSLGVDVPQCVRIKTALVRYGYILNDPGTRCFKLTEAGLRVLQDAKLMQDEVEIVMEANKPLTVIRGDG